MVLTIRLISYSFAAERFGTPFIRSFVMRFNDRTCVRIVGTTKIINTLHLAESMTKEERPHFTKLFEEGHINFAWSYAGMPGIDPKLIMHHFSLPLGIKLVKKKFRKMHPHISLLVKDELKKLLDVGFRWPIDYVEWLSNIVPVSKLDKSIMMCTDFMDLNKACPKDDFPLPSIDFIVDLTPGHKILSLMDGFLGYN